MADIGSPWGVCWACESCAEKLKKTQEVEMKREETRLGRCEWCSRDTTVRRYNFRSLAKRKPRARTGGGEREKARRRSA